ncbi:hypothetical protein Bca52824_011335 [Brassica carinata]|uniref:Uncharacterized protein n=1 Tax=Brassica carinata TaxID=52824 RepID=A0A8X7WG34_BRACI|nr:hypothetical protein Bca52824_011335 [Brassica carinata]
MEPGGLLTKQDIWDETEKCLSHYEVNNQGWQSRTEMELRDLTGAKIVKRSPKNAYGFDRKVSETMNFNGACPCTKTSDILLAIERVNTMSFYNDSSWAAQGHNTLLRRDVNGYLLLASRGLCDGLPEASFGNFVITKIVAIGIPEMAFRGNLKSFDERTFSGKWLLHMFLKNNYKIEYMVKGDSFDNMPLLREDFPLFKSVISLREELEQYVDAINMIICGKFTTPHSFNLCS